MHYNIFAIKTDTKLPKFVINRYNESKGEQGSTENYIKDCLNAKKEGTVINSLISFFCHSDADAIAKLKEKIKKMNF